MLPLYRFTGPFARSLSPCCSPRFYLFLGPRFLDILFPAEGTRVAVQWKATRMARHVLIYSVKYGLIANGFAIVPPATRNKRFRINPLRRRFLSLPVPRISRIPRGLRTDASFRGKERETRLHPGSREMDGSKIVSEKNNSAAITSASDGEINRGERSTRSP